jgi:FixJ family two-component response regulator
VDDDTGVLKALTRVLNGQGYDVLAFSSPAEFLTRHDPSIPGAIFDVSMPGLDGIQPQAALKAGGVERPGHLHHRRGRCSGDRESDESRAPSIS